MKNLIKLIVLAFAFTAFAQTNIPDEKINLALEDDAKVISNVVNGRGEVLDIFYNPLTQAYATQSNYAEHGVRYNQTSKEVLYLQVQFDEPKFINYITFGGSYPNQPQTNTSWKILYKNNADFITLEEGVGGWIDGGIYVYNKQLPITATAIKVELQNVNSTTLRSRGAKSESIDDSATATKASLIQFLPYDGYEETPELTELEKELLIMEASFTRLLKLAQSHECPTVEDCPKCEDCKDCNDNGDDDDDEIILPPSNNGLAFPSAIGAGAKSVGGKGGKVIHVTTLDFGAKGGLKEAIESQFPRIIVFDVSGIIDASNYEINPSLTNLDNMTIAGQTAPHGGITVVTSYFIFRNMSDVIVRYVRFRSADTGFDAIAHFNGSNIIYDHCTFSHGSDEAGSWNNNKGHLGNVTIQNCFFQDSKTGTLLGVGGDTGDFTFVNNLYSSISHRFPNGISNGQYDIINNVVYNWKYRLMRVAGSGKYNVINNYYKTSRNGIRQASWFPDNGKIVTLLHKLQVQINDSPLIYGSGSIITGQRETPKASDNDMWTAFLGSYLSEHSAIPSKYFTDKPFDLVGEQFQIKTAYQAYEDVLNNVGANKTLNADGSINHYQDEKDKADIKMIRNDTYDGGFYSNISTIPHPIIPSNKRDSNYDSNGDGIPDVYAKLRGFDIDTDLSLYDWKNGNIGCEEFINLIDKK